MVQRNMRRGLHYIHFSGNRLSDERACGGLRGARVNDASSGMSGNEPWVDYWLVNAVQWTEREGPLDDHQALLQSRQTRPNPEMQITERAWILAERLHWPEQIRRWRDASWLLVLVAAAAVLALANGLVFAVLTEGRTINAASAFVAALGFHAVSLAAWCVSLLFSRGANPSGGLSIGRVVAALAIRLPLWRGPHSTALVQSGAQILAKTRLSPWVFGLISHAIWTLGFALMLLGLLFAFAFRQYQLTWETTILGPEWFTSFARLTGYLPHWFGVPIPAPSSATTAAAAAAGAGIWPARQAAWWLMACVALYGFLPRAVCTFWCWVVVRRAANRLRLDLTEPYYQLLLARFQSLEPAVISDREQPAPMAVGSPQAGLDHSPRHFAQGLAVVGFEVAADRSWLSSELQKRALLAEPIAGDRQEQVRLQARLGQLRPKLLLVVCDAAASPDRGTLRFLRSVSILAGQRALLVRALSREGDAATDDELSRWHAWATASGLKDWQVLDSESAAAEWVRTNE